MIPLVILSPTPALRAGLRAMLSGEAGLSVVGVAANLEDLGDSLDQAAVIVATPGGVGLEGEGLAAGQSLLWVTGSPDAALLAALGGLELRAWGILPPDATAEALHAAIRALAEGFSVAPPEALRLLNARAGSVASLESPPSLDGAADGENDPLTGRETEVIQLLASGLTNKQIAHALNISEHTVKFHVSAIYSKLAVSNRAEAVRKGARLGWVAL